MIEVIFYYHSISFVFFVCCVYVLYYITHVLQKPVLYCSNKLGFKQKLVQHIEELKKDHWPFIWCYHPLMQALIYSIVGDFCPARVQFKRETVSMTDGGSFTLDWYGFEKNNNCKRNQPISIILPGATGHSEKTYIQELITSNLEMKNCVVVLNYRGLGNNVKLTSPRLSSVLNDEDLIRTLSIVSKRYPEAPVLMVALSIGACTLINYLARKGKSINPNIVAAYVMCVPWSSFESKYLLSRFWNHLVINRHMTQEIKSIITKNYEIFASNEKKLSLDLKDIYESKTVWDLDDRLICPLFGYKNHVEYYAESSLDSLPLENISIPLLCLNAEDDPLCRKKAIPFEKILANPLLAVITTKHGGHLTWLEGYRYSSVEKRLHHRILQQYIKLLFGSNDGDANLDYFEKVRNSLARSST